MIRSVDPRLPRDVLFLLWSMGHGDEVAVLDSCYLLGQDGRLHGPVVQMFEADVSQAMRAVLSAVQIDTSFVAEPVRQIESGPLCEVRDAVQAEVDDALGFRCSITPVAHREFHEQVRNCYGLIVTGDARKQGNFILRKGLDVTPESILSPNGKRSR